jgi:hypothetical protein
VGTRCGHPAARRTSSRVPQRLMRGLRGQWFQLESGLHYNWHRHYEPSLGRAIHTARPAWIRRRAECVWLRDPKALPDRRLQ